jgi:glycosyltransferase involved in cell wall biosynthesis
VLRQTYRNLEIIVVDDGSTDDTAAVARRAAPFARILSQPNRGAAAARNAGVAAASGELLAFLDADDLWSPDKLEEQVRVFSQHPGVAVCTTDAFRFDSAVGQPVFPDARGGGTDLVTDFTQVFRTPYLATPTVMMRRRVFLESGGFRETLQVAEDVDLWLRACYGRVLARIRRPMVAIGRSRNGLTARHRAVGLWKANDAVVRDFVASTPGFGRRHWLLIRRTRADLLVSLGGSHLTWRRANAAIPVLARAVLLYPFSLSAYYLLAKALGMCVRTISGTRDGRGARSEGTGTVYHHQDGADSP